MTRTKGIKMLKVIAYIRVSTADQAEDGVSLDAQRGKIDAWCMINDAELVNVHIDAGISGKRSDNRPGLQAALDEAVASGAVLVVYSLSRLARNTKETIEIAERLERAGADLVSLSEKIDTTSAAGKMVFRMLAVLAEFERDLVSERTTGAMAYKRSKGERISRHIPYGFDLSEDGVHLIENESEQRVLSLVSQLRDSGLSLRKIAAELGSRGIKPKNGKSKWSHSTIQQILNRAA